MLKLVYIKCRNDDDGNPRRGWALFDGEQPKAFFEYRHIGEDAVPPKHRHLILNAETINVNPRAYQAWVTQFGESYADVLDREKP